MLFKQNTFDPENTPFPPSLPENDEEVVEQAPRKRKRGCFGIFLLFMLLVGAAWGALLGAFVWLQENTSDTVKALEDFRPKLGSKIFSADGALLGEFAAEQRQYVRLSEIPLFVQKAVIATEDSKFYEHRGVRLESFLTVLVDSLRTGDMRGASTITMQLVRNVAEWNVESDENQPKTQVQPPSGWTNWLKSLTQGEVGTERDGISGIIRKLREIIVAFQVDRRYTKDDILEMYLNGAFLGVSAHGVQAAAQQYFGKDCWDLTLGEAATLAGLLRAPNATDLRAMVTISDPEARAKAIVKAKRAADRRDIVLTQMLENQFITREQYDAAIKESLMDEVITPEKRAKLVEEGKSGWAPNKFQAPYFSEEVRQFIRNQSGQQELFYDGLEIYTTLDMHLQQAAEKALLSALDDFDKKKRESLKREGKESEFVPVSGALVCIDNRPQFKGFVRAMVGGRDFEKEKYNTATQAKRQPGSSVKPFVWAAAIASGMTPSTIEVDEPYTFTNRWGKEWSPKNFRPEYLGPITLRTALHKSVNIVSVKLVQKLTMPVVRSYMQRAGIRTPIENAVGPTIALGTPEVTILDQCTAYSTFANGGMRYDPLMVTEIKNRDGIRVYDYQTATSREHEQAMPANVAYVMTYLMQGVCKYGTGASTQKEWETAQPGRPRAGKTGTTNESRNTWFCGFTPDFTCVVWLGYRDNRSLGSGEGFTGGRLANPIWTKFMIEAEKGLPVRDFDVPKGVVFFNVDLKSGLAGGSFKEAFIEGTAPPNTAPASSSTTSVVGENAPPSPTPPPVPVSAPTTSATPEPTGPVEDTESGGTF